MCCERDNTNVAERNYMQVNEYISGPCIKFKASTPNECYVLQLWRVTNKSILDEAELMYIDN